MSSPLQKFEALEKAEVLLTTLLLDKRIPEEIQIAAIDALEHYPNPNELENIVMAHILTLSEEST